jgi:hypothetical protein
LNLSACASRFSARISSIFLFAGLAASTVAMPFHAIAQQPAPAAKSPSGSANGVDKTIDKSSGTESAAEDENNFAIIALAIVIPLVRIMPKVIRKRSETLRHDLDSARKLTEDANARLSAVEAKLAKLDEEIAGIRAHVEEEGKNDEVRIKATLKKRAKTTRCASRPRLKKRADALSPLPSRRLLSQQHRPSAGSAISRPIWLSSRLPSNSC